MKTIQTNEEIIANAKAKAFLAYIEPTKFYLIADPRTQTQVQYDTAMENATLFNNRLYKNKNTPDEPICASSRPIP